MATDRRPRARALVPSLRALALGRRAFTLVELMVAIAISTVIVLTAVASFRMVAKAVASANALSTENSLLRSGLQLALADVDYWHSHADDQPPYNKGFMRLSQRRDDTASDDTIPNSHGNDIFENTWRRPFQPVRYAPRTDTAERDPFPAAAAPVTGVNRDCGYYNSDAPTAGHPFWNEQVEDDHYREAYNRNDYVPNPNMLLAHDPRAICRQIARPMRIHEVVVTNPHTYINTITIPTTYVITEGSGHYGGYRLGFSKITSGDYSLVSSTDMRDLPSTTMRYPANDPVSGPQRVVTAKKFEFAELDETLSSALLPAPRMLGQPHAYLDATPNKIDIPVDNGWGSYQPLLWTSLFQRLNYYGLFEYMTPGTTLLWGDRMGRTPDIGTVPLPPYTYRQGGPDTPTGANWFQYVIDYDACFNMGTCDLATRMGERFIPSPANGGRSGRAIEAVPLRTCWPALGSDGDLNYGKINFDYFNYKSPFTVFLGTGEFDWANSSDYQIMFATWELGVHLVEERADISRVDDSATATTVWLPYNTTDADRATPTVGTALAPTKSWYAMPQPLDYTSKPMQAPIMKTSIMRYGRVAGSQDLTVARVTIDDPTSGKKTELTCMPFGTTFRGARQHWRLYSPALTTVGAVEPGHRFARAADQCIGDFYDTAAGPYYVP